MYSKQLRERSSICPDCDNLLADLFVRTLQYGSASQRLFVFDVNANVGTVLVEDVLHWYQEKQSCSCGGGMHLW